MRIKVTSDSTSDLPQELLDQYDISLAPLHIIKGDGDFKDGVDISPDDIFDHVSGGGDICTTAAVNIVEYITFFDKFAKEYDAIIHVNIGSEFSSCHQNALLAAEDFDNVYVIDSENLSSGHGHVVIKAAKMAGHGEPIENIKKSLDHLIPRVRASFLLNRLDYMAKGGRCSSIVALGANLLKLKPCIEVKDGVMGLGKKCRGSLEKCLLQYVDDKLSNPDNIDGEMCFITYTTVMDKEIIKKVRQAIEAKGIFKEIYESNAGCTVTCHCGQNTLGILFVEK